MNEPKQPSLIQKQFDIPKFDEQRRMLDATTFNKSERNGVGKQLLKSILNRFGSMRECTESQKTLARVFGVRRETIGLAIKRLTALDLITKERKWSDRYQRVLNHHRLNWTELARRLERHSSDSKKPDQCEDSPDTIVRIHGGLMLGSAPDQCEVSPDTNVRFHADRNRRANEIETTTTNDEWKRVVVSLEKNGVSQTGKAIAKAKERGDSPDDVLRIIERTVADPRHRGKDLGGIVYNQVCTPTPEPLPTPTTKLKQPKWELIRTKVFRAMQSKGKRACELDNATIDAKADAIYERELAEFENQQKNPFGTLATEPTR